MIPQNVYDLIRDDEGDVDHVYFLNGIPHVGVGHNLINGPRLSPAVRETIFKDDVAFFASKCRTLGGWDAMSDARQAVVLDLCFNLGFGGLLNFEQMLHAISEGDWDEAARQILDSKAATEPGLEQRYQRLAQIMRTNEIRVAKG